MLAQTSDSILSRTGKLALMLVAAVTLMSCASKEPPPLIADESAGRESALPWNKQEKWEVGGEMGTMADRVNPGSRGGN